MIGDFSPATYFKVLFAFGFRSYLTPYPSPARGIVDNQSLSWLERGV
jgi:hypothetical protein